VPFEQRLHEQGGGLLRPPAPKRGATGVDPAREPFGIDVHRVYVEQVARTSREQDLPRLALLTIGLQYSPESRSGLRRVLEADREQGQPWQVLLTRRPGYLLDVDPMNVDAERFARGVDAGRTALRRGRPEQAAALLVEALLEWHGEPLADAATPPSRKTRDDV
jgi:hypothetical protein